MKFKLIIINLLFFYFQTSAQITFEKVIDTLGSTTASCIRETLDGGYVFCGNSNYNGNDFQVVKMDSLGNIEWVKSYTGPAIEYATEIEQLSDSTYIVNGAYDSGNNSKSWLIALDAAGDSLWSQLYSAGPGATNVILGNSMAVMNNSLMGLTGYYSPPSLTHTIGYFFAVIGNGFQLASRMYDFSPYGTEPRGIATTSNNEYLITGAIGTNSSSNSDIFLLRTTLYGDTIWYKTFDLSYQECGLDVLQTSDNGVLIAGFAVNPVNSSGNICLIKTDVNGDTLWTKKFNHSSEQIAYSVQETQNGDFILTGNITGGIPFSGDVFLMKINSSGDSLWSKQFGGNSGDIAYSVRAVNNGGFIVAGNTNSFGNGGSYIIKTDSIGNILTGTGELTFHNSQFSVYPNPGKDKIFIKTNSGLDESFRFEIFDLQGKLIYENIFNGELNSVNTAEFPSTVYFCKLKYKSSVSYLKLVIID